MLRLALVLTLLAAAPYYRVGCECAGESGWQPGSEWTAGNDFDGGYSDPDGGFSGADGGFSDPDGGYSGPDAGSDAGTGLDGGTDGGTRPDAGASGGDAGTDACGGCPVNYYCDKKECLPCCTGFPPVCAC